jgi:hypothetical protein
MIEDNAFIFIRVWSRACCCMINRLLKTNTQTSFRNRQNGFVHNRFLARGVELKHAKNQRVMAPLDKTLPHHHLLLAGAESPA